jgi:DNA-binding CsgD family transcriptional regulator
MVVLARCVGVIGDGWARDVTGDALLAAGCSIVALDDPHRGAGYPHERDALVDVVVVVGDGLERVRTACGYGVGCLQIRSHAPTDDELVEALLAGANGVMTDSSGVADLYEAVRIIADGGVALSSRDVRRVLDRLRRDRGTLRPRIELTARQRSVLELIVRGESVKQTARTLGIAVKTVENTQSRLYRRLGVRNRSQAVAVAMQSGLVAPGEA